MIGVSRIAKTSSKAHVKWERIVHSHIHQKKNRSTRPSGTGEGKGYEKEKAMVAVVKIANHRQRSGSGKFFNTHLKAEGNIEQVEQSAVSVKGIHAFMRKLPSEKISIIFSYQSLERATIRDQFPSVKVIQTNSKNDLQMHHHRMT